MLMRTDPFADMEQLIGQLLAPGARESRPGIPVDAWREGDAIFLALDLPGVDPDSIDVDVDRRMLTVSAERKAPYSDAPLSGERRHGRFVRRFTLGEALDVDAIRAGYEAGVLTLRIPFAERSMPRKIAVHSELTTHRTVESGEAATGTPEALAGHTPAS